MPGLIFCLWLLPAPAVNQLGAGAFARGDFPAAQQLFLLAWRQRPDANVASNLAATARRLRDWPAADRWFTLVIELRSETLGADHADTAIAWNNRGEARLQGGRPSAARSDLKHAKALARAAADQAVILHNLGELARREGQLAEARASLQASLALRPQSPATAELLASVLAELGQAALERARLHEAIQLCREASALAPSLARPCQERIALVAVDAGR